MSDGIYMEENTLQFMLDTLRNFNSNTYSDMPDFIESVSIGNDMFRAEYIKVQPGEWVVKFTDDA